MSVVCARGRVSEQSEVKRGCLCPAGEGEAVPNVELPRSPGDHPALDAWGGVACARIAGPRSAGDASELGEE